MIAEPFEVKTLLGRNMHADTKESREFSPADALEAALDWWRDAGVEEDYSNDATSWLAEPEAEQAVASVKPAKLPEEPRLTPVDRAFENAGMTKVIAGSDAPLPDTLEKFREWWMTDKTLHPAGPEQRIPPDGVASAKLMVLIPEPLDGEKEKLCSGEAGRFLEALLAAMGIQRHEAYVASALPAPMAMADWAELSARGLGEVIRHHVALAMPHRVLVFGRALSPLFDIDPAASREPAVVKAANRTLPLLLAPELPELARSAPRRRNFWDRWLEWTV